MNGARVPSEEVVGVAERDRCIYVRGGRGHWLLSNRPLMAALTGTVVIGLACAVAMAEQEGDPGRATRANMLMVRRAIAHFIAERREIPATLSIICAVERPGCVAFSGEEPPKDGWGRTLVYRSTPSGLELRSRGADGVDGTSDDLVFDAGRERAAVGASAGCYQVDWSSWWPAFSAGQLILRESPVEEGMYELLPILSGYLSQWWVPVSGDSVEIRWTAGFQGVTLFLERGDVGLRGVAVVWSDAHPPRRQSIVARKMPC